MDFLLNGIIFVYIIQNNNLLRIEFPFFAQISYTENKVPVGWSANKTEVRFDIEAGYPIVTPHEFWMDEKLLLSDGRHPMNTNIVIDTFGKKGLYSRLYFNKWNPNGDNLLTIARTIRQRFVNIN